LENGEGREISIIYRDRYTHPVRGYKKKRDTRKTIYERRDRPKTTSPNPHDNGIHEEAQMYFSLQNQEG
jgi:hypothetical protein